MQHNPSEHIEIAKAVPARLVHHAGGRAMAMDAVGVLHEFLGQLAGVWRHLVFDRVHARRLVSRKL